MRYIVKLTDGSETELDHMTWRAAADQAVAWHAEISRSACWDPEENPVQLASISAVLDHEDNGAEYTLVSSREFWQSVKDTQDNLNWREEKEGFNVYDHVECNTEISAIGWPEEMVCCHTHQVIFRG